MSELSVHVLGRIQAHCKTGDICAARGDYSAALERCWAAWDLLPEPQTKWDAATWILGAIGEANFLGDDFAAGKDNLSMAMRCPGANGNPFLHLRLGQCEYELGNMDRAADELARAYIVGGDEVFAGADKYLDFLKTKIKPAAGD